jgi:hypothetical protein
MSPCCRVSVRCIALWPCSTNEREHHTACLPCPACCHDCIRPAYSLGSLSEIRRKKKQSSRNRNPRLLSSWLGMHWSTRQEAKQEKKRKERARGLTRAKVAHSIARQPLTILTPPPQVTKNPSNPMTNPPTFPSQPYSRQCQSHRSRPTTPKQHILHPPSKLHARRYESRPAHFQRGGRMGV